MCCPHPGEKWNPVCCNSLPLEQFHLIRALPLVNCKLSCLDQQSPTSLALGTGFLKDNFLTDWGWCGDDSSALPLLCTLFLLLFYQLLLRSSGIWSQRLGTPGLEHCIPQLLWISEGPLNTVRFRILLLKLHKDYILGTSYCDTVKNVLPSWEANINNLCQIRWNI